MSVETQSAQTVQNNFKSWCIVEIMGHQRFAGLVTEEALGGTNFIRIDVPEIDGVPAFTKFFSNSAIYCITPCSEDIARQVATSCRKVPFYEFSAPAPARIGGPTEDDDDFDDRELNYDDD